MSVQQRTIAGEQLIHDSRSISLSRSLPRSGRPSRCVWSARVACTRSPRGQRRRASFWPTRLTARHAGPMGSRHLTIGPSAPQDGVHPALDDEVRDAGKLVDVAGIQQIPDLRHGRKTSSDRTGGSGISGNSSAIGSSCGRISASVRFLFTDSTTRRSSSLWRMTRSGRRWRPIVRNSWGPRWGDGGFAYASDAYAASAFDDGHRRYSERAVSAGYDSFPGSTGSWLIGRRSPHHRRADSFVSLPPCRCRHSASSATVG